MADPDPNAPPPNPAAKWFDGLEDADKGVIQNHNWHELDPAAAAKAVFSYGRDLEKKLGLPADQVLRIPAADDAAGWKSFYAKLGAPATADGYDFSTVKKADGTALPDDIVTTVRETAAKLNLPVPAAASVAEAFVRLQEKRDAAEKLADTIEITKQTDALKASWGASFDNFKFMADRAAAMVGMTPEELNALAASTSYGVVMNGLLKIAQKAGEASLLGLDNTGNGARMLTREQAAARLEDITSGRDPEFVKRWRAGERAALDEKAYLDKTIVGAR